MKKIRTIFVFLLCTLVLFSAAMPAFASADTDYNMPPLLHCNAALLVDLDTGRALYGYNAEERVYPASLTKIMTCLLALEYAELTDVVTVSETALQDLDPNGTTMDLKVGEELTLDDLLHAITVGSANDACNVIAEHVSGSVSSFVALMNRRAQELGCTGTQFTNTHGLHDELHYTTAKDLALITMAALQYEPFRLMSDKTSHTIPATNLSAERKLYTSNYLISTRSRSDYYYPEASGIKTGFTTPAGRCVISRATSGKMNLMAIVLGATTMVKENGDLEMYSFTDAKNLFAYGFRTFRHTTLVTPLEPLGKVPVSLSNETTYAVYAPAQALTALLPTDYDESLVELSILLDSPDGITAPVSRDQKLGIVRISYNGEYLGETDLLSIAAIERSFIKYMGSRISAFFRSSLWNVILGILCFLLLAVIITMVILILRARRARKRKQDKRRREKMQASMRGGHNE